MSRQAQHERGGAVRRLVPHPQSPPDTVTAIDVEWREDAGMLRLAYVIHGAALLVVPDPAPAARRDELWMTTCAELFCKPVGGTDYIEFNFSPSSRWAAYAFDGYRDGMRDLAVASDPVVTLSSDGERCVIAVDLDPAVLPAATARASLSVVIEEQGGTKSFWALAHPAGPFDFHDEACFVLELPAPRRP